MTTPLAGCPEVISNCPPLVKYSKEFLQKAYVEYQKLPTGSPLKTLITDYSKTRDACRANLES